MGVVPAVRDVSFSMDRGETLGLVGESGCGKSTLALMIAGLEKPTAGEIRFDGAPLEEVLRTRRGRRRIQEVFQHPMESLNRRYSVGRSVREPLEVLSNVGRGAARQRMVAELGRVSLVGYEKRRPRELSGGQAQRAAIARALICEPDLLILDEPTSSLDQSLRAVILRLLSSIQQERGIAYLFITHDIDTVGRIADRIAVMYLGKIVELATCESVLRSPKHPYTIALLSAVPSLDPLHRRQRIVLRGEAGALTALPKGCAFQDRCPLVHGRCRIEEPPLVQKDRGHAVACFAAGEGPTRIAQPAGEV
jgi:dipeptide transport system ATP-binding protein